MNEGRECISVTKPDPNWHHWCWRCSQYHHEPGIRLDPRAEVVVICEVNEQRCQQRVGEWGVPFSTSDYEEICQSPDVDAVIVATPNFSHKDIVHCRIDAGKHVFSEKPLGLKEADAQAMNLAAEKA